jgi:soluble lytic murein transglycosylase
LHATALHADVALKNLDFPSYHKSLERLASNFPLSPIATQAFTTLVNRQNDHQNPYYFCLKLLKELAFNADLAPGLKDFIAAQISQKIRTDKYKVGYLTSIEKVHAYLLIRRYDLAYETGSRAIDLEFDDLSHADQTKLLELTGKSLMRLERYPEALRVFGELRRTAAAKKQRIAHEWLADALYYNRFYEDAAKRFQHLATKSSQLPQWFHFWNQYHAQDYSGIMRLFARSLVPPRDDSKTGIDYWHARTLARTGNRAASEGLFKKILSKRPYGIYSHMVANEAIKLSQSALAGKILHAKKPWPLPSIDPSLKQFLAMFPENGRRALTLAKHGDKLQAQAELQAIPFKKIKKTHWPILMALSWRCDDFKTSAKYADLLLRDQEKTLSNWTDVTVSQSTQNQLWESVYPKAFQDVVEKAAAKYKVDNHLIYSIMRAESRYDQNAISYVGARGLMQIMPYTGQKIAIRKNDQDFQVNTLWEVTKNIDYSAWYLAELNKIFSNHPALVIAAYNAGPAAVETWFRRYHFNDTAEFIDGIPFKETRRYVKEVLTYLGSYNQIYRRRQHNLAQPISLNSQYMPSALF